MARTHNGGLLQEETASDNYHDDDIQPQHEVTRTKLILRETREVVGQERHSAQDDDRDMMNWYSAEARGGEDMRYLVEEEEMGEDESGMQYSLEAMKAEAYEQVCVCVT
jgi:hypothetical protein